MILLSKIFISFIFGANFFELVGPNKTIIGMSAKPIICIIPLSIDMALSNLFERALTNGGPDKEDMLSGKIAKLTSFFIFEIISVSFLSIKKTIFLFLLATFFKIMLKKN